MSQRPTLASAARAQDRRSEQREGPPRFARMVNKIPRSAWKSQRLFNRTCSGIMNCMTPAAVFISSHTKSMIICCGDVTEAARVQRRRRWRRVRCTPGKVKIEQSGRRDVHNNMLASPDSVPHAPCECHMHQVRTFKELLCYHRSTLTRGPASAVRSAAGFSTHLSEDDTLDITPQYHFPHARLLVAVVIAVPTTVHDSIDNMSHRDAIFFSSLRGIGVGQPGVIDHTSTSDNLGEKHCPPRMRGMTHPLSARRREQTFSARDQRHPPS